MRRATTLFLREITDVKLYVLKGLASIKRLKRRITQHFGSSLARRIVLLNVGGLIALLLGFLYLNQFREGLIEARVQSLITQGEIIASAIAASATTDTDTTLLDPDHLLELQNGESLNLGEDAASPLEFSINPEQVAPVLRRLVGPTRTRARLYDRDGLLLLDSRALSISNDVLRFDLPAPSSPPTSWMFRTWQRLRAFFSPAAPRIPEAIGPRDGRKLTEVQRALTGARVDLARLNERGETIVSVALPIQRGRTVRGVLLLSTQGGDIDAIIGSERFALVQIFLIALSVMVVLSLLLASTIAGPVRRLAESAERVRRGIRSRQEIPDFTSRTDEIGHLSGALRDMTQALYNRIDGTERFAADVAHELKNPLTSLRSAVETLPLARNDESRARLMSIIQHDVRRLDRLISDISDASRLDAELSRDEASVIDMAKLLQTVVSVANEVRRDRDVPILLHIAPHTGKNAPYKVQGHDSRLGQVIRNLIDNARSFSPVGGLVQVFLSQNDNRIEIRVEDDGPGIPSHALERIFERFYTDRPDQGFGQNSGLGLSISRQIIEAHRGTITARNRYDNEDPQSGVKRTGACFVILLPMVRG
jgi:two-component system, OmpR family, sensor histidine kinase ChvG